MDKVPEDDGRKHAGRGYVGGRGRGGGRGGRGEGRGGGRCVLIDWMLGNLLVFIVFFPHSIMFNQLLGSAEVVVEEKVEGEAEGKVPVEAEEKVGAAADFKEEGVEVAEVAEMSVIERGNIFKRMNICASRKLRICNEYQGVAQES